MGHLFVTNTGAESRFSGHNEHNRRCKFQVGIYEALYNHSTTKERYVYSIGEQQSTEHVKKFCYSSKVFPEQEPSVLHRKICVNEKSQAGTNKAIERDKATSGLSPNPVTFCSHSEVIAFR
jgi:hypothetical protein